MGIDWDETEVLEGEPGDFITYARKVKDSKNWFVGRTNDETARTSKSNFGFLPEGKHYTAFIDSDNKNAHCKTNPQSYEIRKYVMASKSKLSQFCAPDVVYAISLFEVKDKSETKELKKVVSFSINGS
ncbi:MAG: glycoside hydrolase family 97 C-terminal domain-containing protein [Bacteroidota bacterium]